MAFGHYELRDLVGRGGMGEVYQAFDRRRNRVVALKLLPPSLVEDTVYRTRFQREAQTAAQLTEPHVIPIHDFGELDGVLYIDMRLADGFRSLAERIDGRPLQPSVAVALVQQIGAALDAAHAQGLVHRDVKPANILVNDDDFAYLIDFGIARSAESTRVTEIGSTVGSLPYMAPERFSQGYQDHPAADVYSLACVLAECLTGRPVFSGSAEVILRSHLDGAPPLDAGSVPARLLPVIQRGLARNPAERPASTGEFARLAVEALSGGDRAAATTIIAKTNPAGAGPDAPTVPAGRPPTRSNRTRWVAAAAAAVVVLGGGGLLVKSLANGDGPATSVQPPATAVTTGGGAAPRTAETTTSSDPGTTTGSATGAADGAMQCRQTGQRRRVHGRPVGVCRAGRDLRRGLGATQHVLRRPARAAVDLPERVGRPVRGLPDRCGGVGGRHRFRRDGAVHDEQPQARAAVLSGAARGRRTRDPVLEAAPGRDRRQVAEAVRLAERGRCLQDPGWAVHAAGRLAADAIPRAARARHPRRGAAVPLRGGRAEDEHRHGVPRGLTAGRRASPWDWT